MPRNQRVLFLALTLAVVTASHSLAQTVRLRPTNAIYVDAVGAALNKPEGVASDGKSVLVVADTGNRRLVIFDQLNEGFKPRDEVRLAQVPFPIRVGIDSKGEILALDGKSHRLARLTAAGEFKSFVEVPVDSRQEETILRSFAIDSRDNLYLLNVSAGKIVVLDPGGAVVREIAFPPEVGFLSDLTVTSTGVLFAIDTSNRQVFSASKDDAILASVTEPMTEDMAFPTAIAADTWGHLYLADKSGGGIVIVGQNGSFEGRQSQLGWREGFLRYPTGLAASGDYLFVADRGNNRVQRFEIVQ